MATRRSAKKQEKKTTVADIKETVKNVEQAVVEKAEEKIVPEMKEAAKAVVEKAPEEVKEAVKKVKRAAVKKEVKTKIVLQHQGKEIDTKDLIAEVKKEWTKGKNKVSDIKSIDLYIKPEDNAAYYVINGDTTGKVMF